VQCLPVEAIQCGRGFAVSKAFPRVAEVSRQILHARGLKWSEMASESPGNVAVLPMSTGGRRNLLLGSPIVKTGQGSRAWKLVEQHCDIEERVQLVPDWATVRGLYLVSVLRVLDRAGKLGEYGEYFPRETWGKLEPVELSKFLLRLAVAGAVLATPPTVHLGMHRAMRQNALAFATSLIGRAIIRGLAQDPVRLTEQGLAARRLGTNYGKWSIGSRGERFVELQYQLEYIWLDSAIAGAAIGTFESCGIDTTIQTTLVDKFNGFAHLSW